MLEKFPGRIFPEMEELVRRLHERGCEIWAVSSSNEWVIRAGLKGFGISREKILATEVSVENGIVTDRLVRVPSGPGKPKALREVAQKNIDAAFGNSRWDTAMLEMVPHPFAINPNPDLEALARERGWTVYFPDGTVTSGGPAVGQ
jgi:phosphoserine phosphatase